MFDQNISPSYVTKENWTEWVDETKPPRNTVEIKMEDSMVCGKHGLNSRIKIP